MRDTRFNPILMYNECSLTKFYSLLGETRTDAARTRYIGPILLIRERCPYISSASGRASLSNGPFPTHNQWRNVCSQNFGLITNVGRELFDAQGIIFVEPLSDLLIFFGNGFPNSNRSHDYGHRKHGIQSSETCCSL